MENQNNTGGGWLFAEPSKHVQKSGSASGKGGRSNNSRASRPRQRNKAPINGSKKGLAAAVFVSVLLLAGAVMLTVFLSGEDSVAAMSFGSTGKAMLTVNVVEGNTETPIEDAKVVVLETRKVYTTDAKGDTGVIEVPVIRDKRFDGIIPKPWGEVSLIVYKEGFLPYALFYLQVADGKTRSGVKILLFENNSTGSSEPFSIIEGPNRVWVDELVKMFRPKD